MFKMTSLFCVLAFAVLIAPACGGSEMTEEERISSGTIPVTEVREDGKIISKHDLNGDGRPDVMKVYEEYPDADDPSLNRTRMRERHVDVNYDGKINNKREYDESGQLVKEWLDLNLDGKFELVNYLNNGVVIRKEILDAETGKVAANRFYAGGTIVRVEKDLSGNDKIDYWEFYEKGILDRIGRDVNGDGRADSWQTR